MVPGSQTEDRERSRLTGQKKKKQDKPPQAAATAAKANRRHSTARAFHNALVTIPTPLSSTIPRTKSNNRKTMPGRYSCCCYCCCCCYHHCRRRRRRHLDNASTSWRLLSVSFPCRPVFSLSPHLRPKRSNNKNVTTQPASCTPALHCQQPIHHQQSIESWQKRPEQTVKTTCSAVQEEEDDAHECKHQWPSESQGWRGEGQEQRQRQQQLCCATAATTQERNQRKSSTTARTNIVSSALPVLPVPTPSPKKTHTQFPVPSSQCSVLDNWINYDEESKSYNKYFFFF
jgi:hypothetical protein